MDAQLPQSAPRILGVDPGLNVTGYAVVAIETSTPRLCEAGVIRTTARASLAHRIAEVYEGLSDVVETLQPDVMALEQLFTVYKRPQPAILMGHARGVFLVAAAQHMLAVQDYSATRIKKSVTGNGRASKEQVQRAVMGQLRLKALPEPPDVADALAIALCCINEYQREKMIL